ncbi:MAG: hypothetical protein KC609_22825, partial [Myxococcales bacterium]|nr:hypothetical protein [Myxococcales bacterium]
MAQTVGGIRGWLASLGRPAISITEQLGGLVELFGLTLIYTFRGKREKHAVLKQMYYIGNKSML